MKKSVLPIFGLLGGLSLLKMKTGNANLDVNKWRTWEKWQFEDHCKDFIEVFKRCAMGYGGLTTLSMLGTGQDVYKVLDLYNIAQYAFKHKVVTGKAKQVCVRISKYRTWGSKNLQRLIDSFGDLDKIVKTGMLDADDKTQAVSMGLTSTEYFYDIGRFKIDNSSAATGNSKDQLDRVLRKLVAIGESTDFPMFQQVLEGEVRYLPDISNYAGTYDIETGLVNLRSYARKTIEDENYLSTLVHEFGHKLYYTRLSQEQLRQIEQLWQSSVATRNSLIANWRQPNAKLGFCFSKDVGSGKGEVVFHDMLNGKVRVKYPSVPNNIINTGYGPRAFSNRIKKWHRGVLPTTYANKNASEMFSEIVTAYILREDPGYILEPQIEFEIKRIMGF